VCDSSTSCPLCMGMKNRSFRHLSSYQVCVCVCVFSLPSYCLLFSSREFRKPVSQDKRAPGFLLIADCFPSPFIDFKSQPEPSPVLSQLSQRQQHQTQAVSVPPPGLESFSSLAKPRESTAGDGPSTVSRLLQLPNMTVENIVSAHQPQPKHIKLPKRRVPPASKVSIPS
jgi:hypothetical protein